MEKLCVNCRNRHLCTTFDLMILEAFNADLSYPLFDICKDYVYENLYDLNG